MKFEQRHQGLLPTQHEEFMHLWILLQEGHLLLDIDGVGQQMESISNGRITKS